jgi:hypothetical protein
MKIGNVKVYGFEDSVRASKYPMSVDTGECSDDMTPTVKKLASCAIGTGHDQFLTGIIVQFDLTFSIKAWTEMQRYHFIDFVSSQSTMHRAAKFNPESQCNEYVTKDTIEQIKTLVERYNASQSKEDYLTLLYNLPVGFQLTARMTTNYRQFKTIYQQRKAHRLPEWREFCKWIETLPHSELITGE